jgi:hypothetical protein
MAASPEFTALLESEGSVSRALHALVAEVPAAREAATTNPRERVRRIGQIAALNAGALAGAAALPPGPIGLATVLPDLLGVWRLQQQMVADIAAAFGKTKSLKPETMVVCLFRHADESLTRHLIAHQGESIVVRRVTRRTLQLLLQKIGIRIAQRVAARSLARWVPVGGALGVGAHAYYDTRRVAATATELFAPRRRASTRRGAVTTGSGDRQRPRRRSSK